MAPAPPETASVLPPAHRTDIIAVLLRKCSTGFRVLRSDGPSGVARLLIEKSRPPLRRVSSWLDVHPRIENWRYRDHWWVGRLVELLGNRVWIDGCVISVDDPAISTLSKSRLVTAYEVPERQAIRNYLDPSLPVVECGASIGVVACITNRKLRHPERHVVIEPNPLLLPLLERNRRRNRCQFVILHGAIAYGAEQVPFHLHPFFVAGNMVERTDRTITVPALQLRDALGYFEGPCTLICDIEGTEPELVKYDAEALQTRVALLILETHNWWFTHLSDCSAELEGLGFTRVFQQSATSVYRNTRLRPSALLENESSRSKPRDRMQPA